MKITHKLLERFLEDSHAAAKSHFTATSNWPQHTTPQSNWTLWAHYTIAAAMTGIYKPKKTATMSLRVSRTKKHPAFWGSAVAAGIVHDYTTQQQALDFCLMGPTAERIHYLTAESECKANDSVSISLTGQGYIWDWSKLLGDRSEHRLFFVVVGGNSLLKPGSTGRPDMRRSALMANMKQFFEKTHRGRIMYPEGICGYILAHHDAERKDSYTFIVRKDKVHFSKINAAISLV